MNAISVLHSLEQLSPDAQQQVLDFIEFIKIRQTATPANTVPTGYGFGTIRVTKQVSLQQMDEAIEQGVQLLSE